MRIVTNFKRIPERWTAHSGLQVTNIPAETLVDFLRNLRGADLLLINSDLKSLTWLCVLFTLVPALRKPVIAVDVVLRQPVSRLDRLKGALRRVLFKRVDHFIHYFTDLSGFEKWHGIDARRSSFVPFKVNIYDQVTEELRHQEGDVVLCAGRSLRDFDTFFDATENQSYSTAIAEPDIAGLGAHGARFTRSREQLPGNLKLLPDGGSAADWLALLARAKVVVIPTLKSSLCASGISTYLDAMMLEKPVVVSKGPGASDVLSDQALLVAAEDSQALREAIHTLVTQPETARQLAQRGRAYAELLGGESAFLDRILEQTAKWYEDATASKGAAHS